jgi:hypothetical protein
MIYVNHRINTIEQLKKINKNEGVEIDIRDYNNKLILTHDPFCGDEGDELKEYLKHYNHKFIILNIKSEGIEYKVKELLNKYQIINYFFLDCSFPMIYKLIKMNENNIAIRLSEYESIENVLKLKKLVKYVWLDCFTTDFIINKELEDELHKNGFKICIVSPELQGHDISNIKKYKKYIHEIDYICTKHINLWK